ncbi:hypothetical protein ACQ4PT_018894 [Festuca glaucescens]
MTVTLQDMSMILALPIEGKPLCIDTSCEDWRGKMRDLIGKVPDDIINKKGEKLRVSTGATFTWISQNFKTCLEGASRDVIKLYARVYVCFDRRRSKKMDWHKIHRKYVKKFVMPVEEQKKAKGIQYEEHSEDAFNQYLHWFLDNTHVQILPEAYGHEILEEPLIFDDVATLQYNKLVREGRQTSFAPMLNFVRTEIQKQAAEHESALESFPHGEKGESSFREFVKRQGQKLRRLSNLLGCRDPEITTPSHSRSASPSDHDDETNSNSSARDDEVSDEAEGEHEVDEEDEEVPLGKYVKNKRSAYKLKPRKERQDRYTPDAYAKAPARKARKKAVIESDEEEHMEPRQKIPPRRGGKTKRARN